jgi:hypothetical protein
MKTTLVGSLGCAKCNICYIQQIALVPACFATSNTRAGEISSAEFHMVVTKFAMFVLNVFLCRSRLKEFT